GDWSTYFFSINRGKKSIVIDLKKPEGRDLFLRLAEKADVVMENYTPGTMDKLGIGYETLSAVNPRLIHAATSGFGQTGPDRDRRSPEASRDPSPSRDAVSGVSDERRLDRRGAVMGRGEPVGTVLRDHRPVRADRRPALRHSGPAHQAPCRTRAGAERGATRE